MASDSRRILPFPGMSAPAKPELAPPEPAKPEPAPPAPVSAQAEPLLGEPPPMLEGAVLLRDGRRLVDGLTLRLPGRGITALLGPPGAGKSLALRLLAGQEVPDLGVSRALPLATSLVFRRPALLRRSVRGNLDHALHALRMPRRERRARASELIEMAGLSSRAEDPARDLAPGPAQRLAFARAMGARPRLLLLDDPAADLDPAGVAALEAMARRVAQEGTEVLLATRDSRQARRLAARVIFMQRGRDLETAEADAFFDATRSPAARAFLTGADPD